jgi:hypothetical protein
MHTRLSRVQDIAGYRIVLRDAKAQELAVETLRGRLADCRVYDRRDEASHGYRAVHLVTTYYEHAVEVQVRTIFQHLWAQLSERLCDTLGFAGIKYGDYPPDYPEVARILVGSSLAIASFERDELVGASAIRRRRTMLLTRLDQALAILEE